MNPSRLLLANLVLSFAFLGSSFAQDGELDPGFSTDGVAQVTFDRAPADADRAWAGAIQPDGRVLLAGGACSGSGFEDCQVATARLLANGAPDTSWSADGRAVFAFANSPDCDAGEILYRPQDGKIVVVGMSYSDYRIGLARLTTGGLFDATFGAPATPGSITHPLPGGMPINVAAARLQANGAIVVAGSGKQTGFADNDYFVARFTALGALDTTFSNDGVAWINFDRGGQKADWLSDLEIQVQGRILVVGTVEDAGGDYDTGLARLTPTGAFDTDFDGDSGDGNGKVVWENTDLFEDAADSSPSLAVQSTGMIAFAGSYHPVSGGDHALYVSRLFDDGRIDPLFQLALPDLVPGLREYSGGIAAQPNDQLIVVANPLDGSCAVARLDGSAGGIDATFGSEGVTTFDYPTGTTQCLGVELAGTRFVVHGLVNQGGNYNFFAARFTTSLFRDGFETSNTTNWSVTAP